MVSPYARALKAHKAWELRRHNMLDLLIFHAVWSALRIQGPHTRFTWGPRVVFSRFDGMFSNVELLFSFLSKSRLSADQFFLSNDKRGSQLLNFSAKDAKAVQKTSTILHLCSDPSPLQGLVVVWSKRPPSLSSRVHWWKLFVLLLWPIWMWNTKARPEVERGRREEGERAE